MLSVSKEEEGSKGVPPLTDNNKADSKTGSDGGMISD